MEKEYKALLANDTWLLLPPPLTKKIIGNRWVFAITLKADKTLGRYKSRVVSKEHDQAEGIYQLY